MSTTIDTISRRGFLRGMTIGAGSYAFGSLLIHPKETMGQSVQDYLGKVPMEARWDIASSGLVMAQVSLYKTVYEKEGPEKFLEYVKKQCSAGGARSKGLADRLGFTGNDAKSAAAILPAVVILFYGPQQKFEIEEATTEKARLKCLECAFWNVVQTQKITDDLCSAHSRYYWEGFVKAMNPKLTSTVLKARPLGDSVCEWVIELKA